MIKYVIYVYLSVMCLSPLAKREKPDWAKKDITDYTDVDMEHLLDQWEEGDDPLEEDELPEHLRTMPNIDISQFDPKNPEKLLAKTKKGRTLMTFVNVAGNPTHDESEEITKLWQTSLRNNHIQADRYLVDDNRAIFLYKEGSQAWEAMEFLTDQERCESVTIENKIYPGKHIKQTEEDKTNHKNEL